MWYDFLKQKWRNFTYFKKFSALFYAFFVLFALFTLIATSILVMELTKREYKNNQDNISTLAESIGTQMDSLEFFTYKVIDEEDIQKLMTELNFEDLTVQEENQKRSALRNEIYSLSSYERNLNTVYAYDSEGDSFESTLYNDMTFFDSLTTDDVRRELGDEPHPAKWFFSEDGTRAIVARNVFSTDNMEKLGTIVVSLHTSFITNTIENTHLYADSDHFALLYGDTAYPIGKMMPDPITDYLNSDPFSNRYGNQVKRLGGTDYFIAQSAFNQGEMRIVGVMPRSVVLREIMLLGIILFSLFVLLFVFILLVSRRAIQSLVSPINRLAHKMASFNKETHDVVVLRTDEENNRPDEVGALYASFDDLIQMIHDLIQENYQSKILTQEMQFRALQSQLDPHFLYNTLDSINWLAVNNEQDELSEMVTSLAMLFRTKLSTGSPFHTITEEMTIIEAYLTIQKFRFGSRLQYVESIDPSLLSVTIPRLLIQPLIENSLKYGVERMNQPCQVELVIKKEDEALVITVTDNGPGFINSKNKTNHSTGVGLKNIQERIELYYDGKGDVTIHSLPFEKTIISVTLPLP
ncbi:cache domain-containing sensor histidine kinase [Jeotgalibaca caeni]|uniref:cache domain-containing sensor histidine kinase n=1 Tax=Jeotgalibaca caeni TaxID=3028623 RepID=UPI00237E5326|nr:sensor histidine kinase [Jeotgalibaca caeni]MDE1548118.1 sensor histidine kinase [Jeotgalibaca caeni]